MSKKKANIRPELVGEVFTDGKDYFKLVDCQTEPTATFQGLASPLDKTTKSISAFSNLVLMKPERPIVKLKAPRKTRSDKGTHHKPKTEPVVTALEVAMALAETFPETSKEPAIPPTKKEGRKTVVAQGHGLPDISTFSLSTGQGNKPSTLRLGEVAVISETLREGAMELLATSGIDQEYVETALPSEGKTLLLSILAENVLLKAEQNVPYL